LLLSKKEKEKLVIKLANEGKPSRYIAQTVHISLKDIGTVIRRYTGDEQQESHDGSLSLNSKAFKLFKENKNLVDVTIILNTETDQVIDMFNDYLRLSNLEKLISIYKELGDDIHILHYLYNQLKWQGLANKKDIVNIIQKEDELKNMDNILYKTAEEIGRLNSAKFKAEKEIEELIKKIDNYNAFLSEENDIQYK